MWQSLTGSCPHRGDSDRHLEGEAQGVMGALKAAFYPLCGGLQDKKHLCGCKALGVWGRGVGRDKPRKVQTGLECHTEECALCFRGR